MDNLRQTSRKLLDKLDELLLASYGLELTENGALQCVAMVVFFKAQIGHLDWTVTEVPKHFGHILG